MKLAEHLQRVGISNNNEMIAGNVGGWINIRNLRKEREYLKQRQQEIQHQVFTLIFL